MYNMPFFDNSLLLFLAFCASVLLPSVTSIIRLVREKDLLSVMLVLLCGFIASTLLRVIFLVDNEGDEILNQIPIFTSSEKGFLFLDFGILSSLVYVVIIMANVGLWLIIRYIRRETVWKWSVRGFAILLSTIMLIAIAVNALIGGPIEQRFFDVCCGFLWVCSAAWGLTYKEICVIGNIYIEAGLCLLSALWLTWVTVRAFMQRKTLLRGMLMAAGIIYGTVCVVGFGWLCVHYAMPMEEAFDLCYRELVQLAAKWHTTYNIVNYVIFIILFLVLTLGSLLTAKLIQIKTG